MGKRKAALMPSAMEYQDLWVHIIVRLDQAVSALSVFRHTHITAAVKDARACVQELRVRGEQLRMCCETEVGPYAPRVTHCPQCNARLPETA